MAQRISTLIADAQEGGGLIGGDGPVRVRFDNGRIDYASNVKENYGADEDPPVLAIDLVPISDDGEEGEMVTQFWSAGKATRLQPVNDDGEPEAPANWLGQAEGSSATGLTKTCNLMLFIYSGEEAHKGFEVRFNEQGAKAYDGMIAKVERRERPKVNRRGEEAGASDRTPTYLAVSTVESFPGAAGKKGATKTAAPAAAKGKPAASAGNGVDVEALTAQAVVAVVAEAGGEIQKGKLLGLVSQLISNDDEYEGLRTKKPDVTKLLVKADFLKGVDGVELDGTIVRSA
jgi:hypothetical protein